MRAFRELLEKEVVVLPRHQVMGALGVAVLAREWRGDRRTEFKGFEIAGADYRATSFECGACPNLCEIVQIQLDGKVVARWGGRCDRWEGG